MTHADYGTSGMAENGGFLANDPGHSWYSE